MAGGIAAAGGVAVGAIAAAGGVAVGAIAAAGGIAAGAANSTSGNLCLTIASLTGDGQTFRADAKRSGSSSLRLYCPLSIPDKSKLLPPPTDRIFGQLPRLSLH